jgi:RNA polymerase sigma-70 factor (ECF subfamily)
MAQPEAAVFEPADDVSPAPGAGSDLTRPDKLYECYRNRIYTYLRSRTTSEEDAADLAQHVFVQAITGLSRYRAQQGTIGAWLFRIARNAAIDFHRRRRTTVPWDLVPERLQPAAPGDMATSMVEEESLVRLRQQLARLDSASRELLVLRFAGRLTTPEIATVIGLSEAATRKRLSRLLHSLKERYDEPAQ